MRVWVSGSRGKLGSEVCRLLRAAGHTAVEADVRDDEGQRVDLLDRSAVAASLRGSDAIIHCAAIPTPERIAPADLVHTNTMSTFNALEEAWNAGVRVAVLASSGSIYGNAWSPEPIPHPYIPVDEASALQYVDPYALTKDFLERMGQMYARRGMTVTALRLHWILARSEALDLVDSVSDDQGARNLWGYVDLEDAARACVLALSERDREEAYQCLVIAADKTMVTRPTEELVAEYCPDSELRRPITGNDGGFDCSRAERVIGWVPRARPLVAPDGKGPGE